MNGALWEVDGVGRVVLVVAIGAHAFPHCTSPVVQNPHSVSDKVVCRVRSSTGLATTHLIPPAESKLTPTKPLRDYRQAKFMQMPMARPKGHQGPKEILERRGSKLTERLRQNSFLRSDEKPEELS